MIIIIIVDAAGENHRILLCILGKGTVFDTCKNNLLVIFTRFRVIVWKVLNTRRSRRDS